MACSGAVETATPGRPSNPHLFQVSSLQMAPAVTLWKRFFAVLHLSPSVFFRLESWSWQRAGIPSRWSSLPAASRVTLGFIFFLRRIMAKTGKSKKKAESVFLVCEETGDYNYTVRRKPGSERLELMKYSPRLRRHTKHVQKKK